LDSKIRNNKLLNHLIMKILERKSLEPETTPKQHEAEVEKVLDGPNIASLAYASTLGSFTVATASTLALHIMGRHGGCRRNMAFSAFLGLLAMLSQNLKPYMSPSPAVNFLEALAGLTIVFTPLILLLAKLTQLNNEAAQAIHTSKPRRKIGEGLLTNLGDVQDSNPAAGQDSLEPEPSPPFILQEMTPVQTSQESLKPTPSQKTIAPQQHVSENQLGSTVPKNISGHDSTPANPAKQPKLASSNGGDPQNKNKLRVEDIISSKKYARSLERQVVEILSEGVRYNKMVYKVFLSFIRYQDIVYIWRLGNRKKKPILTERAKHRLLSLMLIKVRKKVRLRKNAAEIVEEVELTERGWAVRNAITIAAQRIQEKMAARIAVQTV